MKKAIDLMIGISTQPEEIKKAPDCMQDDNQKDGRA